MSDEETVTEPVTGATEVPKGDEGIKPFHEEVELNRSKRAKKRDATKIRHHLEIIECTFGGETRN